MSGLETAVRILDNIEDISVIKLTNHDVVRHPLVQKIVQAYEVYEENNKFSKGNRENDYNRNNKRETR